MVHRGSRAALSPGCEDVEKQGCGTKGDEVAQVHAAERGRNRPNEARGTVHEGNCDNHRGGVGRQSRKAPPWSRVRAWLRTAMPENEEWDQDDCSPGCDPVFDKEEPALVERDPICAAPDREHGGDCASDKDGGPTPHRDVEGKKREPA